MAVAPELEGFVAAKVADPGLVIPLLPPVATQLLGLVHDPRVSAAQLSELIHKDQSLAAQVLRIANSAAYAPPTPIVSLQQAVARLGLTQISEIVLAASLQAGVFVVPGQELVLRGYWRHSLAASAFARDVARLRRANVESAFLGGFLHGLGRPLVLQLAVNGARHLGLSPGPAAYEALVESHYVGAGLLVAERWKLPDAVKSAIRWHQAPQARMDALLAAWGAALATHALTPERLSERQLRAGPLPAALNLYPDDVGRLLAAAPMVVARVEAIAR